MAFKEVVECGRCGLTTTFTNKVERSLWADRPGCPACTKRAGNDDDDGDHYDDHADRMEAEDRRRFGPDVVIEGAPVQVLAWSVVMDDDGRDTGRRVLEVQLP